MNSVFDTVTSFTGNRSKQSLRIGYIFNFLVTTILLLLFAGQAMALPTKTIKCKRLADPGIQYNTITIDLRTIYVHDSISDPGGDFEFKTTIATGLYETQNWNSQSYCSNYFSWGEVDYPKPNLYKGNYYEFNHGGKVVISNVPGKGMLFLSIRIKEIDGGFNLDDVIDLSPRPETSVIRLVIYPDQDRAYVVAGGSGTGKVLTKGRQNIMHFGKEKRFDGDGRGEKKIEDSMGLSLIIDGPKGAPVPSTSARDKTCRNYALTAVKQNQQALNLGGCGFRPPTWSSEQKGHFDWCMNGENYKHTANKTKYRENDLQACKAKTAKAGKAAKKDKTCRTYALDAVNYNQRAQQGNCGFKQPVWSNNHQNHFDWCMRGNNSKRAGKENAARRNALQSCLAGSAKAPTTFLDPRWNGAVVDNCARWATDCGGGGAQNFCRLSGYKRATAWRNNRPGRTFVIGSNRFCDGPACVGYQSITCQ